MVRSAERRKRTGAWGILKKREHHGVILFFRNHTPLLRCMPSCVGASQNGTTTGDPSMVAYVRFLDATQEWMTIRSMAIELRPHKDDHIRRARYPVAASELFASNDAEVVVALALQLPGWHRAPESEVVNSETGPAGPRHGTSMTGSCVYMSARWRPSTYIRRVSQDGSSHATVRRRWVA